MKRIRATHNTKESAAWVGIHSHTHTIESS